MVEFLLNDGQAAGQDLMISDAMNKPDLLPSHLLIMKNQLSDDPTHPLVILNTQKVTGHGENRPIIQTDTAQITTID